MGLPAAVAHGREKAPPPPAGAAATPRAAAGGAGKHWAPHELNPAVSYLSLVRLALPSILLQSGAPLAITFQTALIGRKGTELVAAWAIVATATNAATVVFNFLVVGVTAKVTKVVAVGAWAQVGSRIRLALGMALTMGAAACGMLLALQRPLWWLLESSSSPLVLNYAHAYFYLRVAGVPPQLLVMCTSGILQGYKRVNLVAVLQALRVILDVFASYVSLYVIDAESKTNALGLAGAFDASSNSLGLVGVGLGTILASCVVAVAGFVCILLLPPKEGRGKIDIFGPVVAVWRGWVNRSRVADEALLAAPLLPSSEGDLEQGGLGRQSEQLQQTGVAAPLSSQQKEGEVAATAAAGGGGGAAGGEQEQAEEDREEEDEAAEEARVNSVLNESMWKFVWDGLSTMWRSAMVQASFFLVLFCATNLGVHAVAAHQVLMQLWMINIYIADGFATAGTIVASSIAGHLAKAQTAGEQRRHLVDLRTVCWRVLYLGTAAGLSLGVSYWVWQDNIMALFSSDPGTLQQLHGAWLYLVLVQPLNSIVFVYDGLIYAAQAFSYMAACLTLGFFCFFLPNIALAYFYFKSLVAAWFAKGVLNAVRFVVAGYKIHFVFLCPPLKDLPPTPHVGPRTPTAGAGADSAYHPPLPSPPPLRLNGHRMYEGEQETEHEHGHATAPTNGRGQAL